MLQFAYGPNLFENATDAHVGFGFWLFVLFLEEDEPGSEDEIDNTPKP